MNESADFFASSDKSLGLIDVSFADDCLYSSPSPIHPNLLQSSGNWPEEKSVQFLGLEDDTVSNVGATPNAFEDGEKVLKPLESMEPESVKRNGKLNLRKSLAWDSAFFTNAGVLEPEELSCMIGEKKSGRCQLPVIEEGIYRSNDSISTLASDGLTLETLEGDLFGDIRASIQKSSVISTARKLSCEVTESQTIQSSKKAENASGKKLNGKAAPKKLNVGIPASEKITKQSVGTNGESKSLCKPPLVASRISPIMTTTTKRTSLGANRLKVEKNSPRSSNVAGRGVEIPASNGARNTVPRPTPPSKSSLGPSMARKTELSTSSSIDSSGSLSSGSSSKSLTSARRNVDSRVSSGLPVRKPLKNTPKPKNQSTNSHLSPFLKSVTKLPTIISPASSISEWSSGSLSPTSTLNKETNSARSSIDSSSCRNASGDGVLDSKNHCNAKCSVKHGTKMGPPVEYGKRASVGSSILRQPDSMKPTGLRMPSPKIGFFDGVRSSVCSNGSSQSHVAVSSGLPRFRAGSISPREGSNGARLGKLQPGRNVAAVSSPKINVQRFSPSTKSKSPSPLQEPSNIASEFCSTSKGKHCATTPKIQSIMSPKHDGEVSLKTKKVAAMECDVGMGGKDFGFADKIGSFVDDDISSNIVCDSIIEDGLNNSASGLPVITSTSSTVFEVENIMLSQKLGEHEVGSHNYIVDISSSLHDSNAKDKDCFDANLEGLTRQIEALDIQREIPKESSGFQEELLKLPMATYSDWSREDQETVTYSISILERAKDDITAHQQIP